MMEEAERRGDAASAASIRKNIESKRKDGIGSILNYIDKSLLPNCNQALLRADLVARIAPARAMLGETTAQPLQAEGMPDLRVTGVSSTFVPFEADEKGYCTGPFIDLTFNVTNLGGDFPRPVDLQTNRSLVHDAVEKMVYFTVVASFDFGSGGKGGEVIAVDRNKLGGTVLRSGAAVAVPLHLRVRDNQMAARVSTYVEGGAFLKVSNDQQKGPVYETDVDIPIWDAYAVSHEAFSSTDEAGKLTLATRATITNLGKSPTPGPVSGSFFIRYGEEGPLAGSWSGKTDGPVAGGASAQILKRQPASAPLKSEFIVQSSIGAYCPNGEPGDLSDGNRENNARVLLQGAGAQ
jgi:hypothetical protein